MEHVTFVGASDAIRGEVRLKYLNSAQLCTIEFIKIPSRTQLERPVHSQRRARRQCNLIYFLIFFNKHKTHCPHISL